METKKVYLAISNVIAELSRVGISKDQVNSQQKYRFRGIDQVYDALAPLLAKHKLVILPRVISREVTERKSSSGGALFCVVMEIEYDFVSAEDGSSHTIRVVGEAMDSGDKASNKALSTGFKYACFQAFCIPTEGADNDADATMHSVSSDPPKVLAMPKAKAESTPKLSAEERRKLIDHATKLGLGAAKTLEILKGMGYQSTGDIPTAKLKDVVQALSTVAGGNGSEELK